MMENLYKINICLHYAARLKMGAGKMKKNIVIIKGDEQEDRHMQINTSTDYAVRIILYLAKICITVSSSKFAASSSGWCPIEGMQI